MDLGILLIQRIADLSNILARIVDLACNLVRILDCDFIVELLADSNLDKTIVGSRILLQILVDRRICIPLFNPPPTHPADQKEIYIREFFCAWSWNLQEQRITRKYMHAETLALLTKPLCFLNVKY